MEENFWLQTWEDGRLGFHQRDYNVLLLRYWPELKTKDGIVFVPLCGKTKDMVWLREQGHGVMGVEISPIAVEAFFEENHLSAERTPSGVFEQWSHDTIRILNGDLFSLTRSDVEGVTAVYDRASLVALPTEMRQQYAQKMAEILPTGTKVLLISFQYPQGQMGGPPFSVSHSEVVSLYSKHFSWERVRSKDIANKVRFPVRSFVQNVYILEKK